MAKEKVNLPRRFDPEKRAAKNATTKERNIARKERRRKEAEERNAAYGSLSVSEKLAVCRKSRFSRKKEIAKLEKQLSQQKDGRR